MTFSGDDRGRSGAHWHERQHDHDWRRDERFHGGFNPGGAWTQSQSQSQPHHQRGPWSGGGQSQPGQGAMQAGYGGRDAHTGAYGEAHQANWGQGGFDRFGDNRGGGWGDSSNAGYDEGRHDRPGGFRAGGHDQWSGDRGAVRQQWAQGDPPRFSGGGGGFPGRGPSDRNWGQFGGGYGYGGPETGRHWPDVGPRQYGAAGGWSPGEHQFGRFGGPEGFRGQERFATPRGDIGRGPSMPGRGDADWDFGQGYSGPGYGGNAYGGEGDGRWSGDWQRRRDTGMSPGGHWRQRDDMDIGHGAAPAQGMRQTGGSPGASMSASWGGGFAGRGPRGYQRQDSRIEEDVHQRLTHEPMLDASDIEVRVKDGEVTLTGSVDSRQAKRIAEDTLDGIFGLREVNNQLRVKHGMTQGQVGGPAMSGASAHTGTGATTSAAGNTSATSTPETGTRAREVGGTTTRS